MQNLIVSLFGSYTSPTYSVTDAAGVVSNIIPAGFAGVDWQWVAGVFLFAIVLHGFLRMVGVLLKNG